MKYIYSVLTIALLVLTASCSDYLDINENPNQATSVGVELILPQAITGTASIISNYNNYGAQIGGYSANAGGYGGFNELVTYNYTSGNYAGLWSSSYDNLEDYQYIMDNTNEEVAYSYFNAVSRIMKVYNLQMLVDTYNDIPYSEALQGANSLTPSYDDAATIYVDLADQLDDAIATINTALELEATGTVITDLGEKDVLFAGDMSQWKKLANTIKLRLLVRGNGKANFTNTAFDSEGFLTTDALINPGFTRDVGRQNPYWNTWAFSYTGGAATKSWIPSTFVMGFYDGTKLVDNFRGSAIYYEFPGTGTNQLGYENTSVPSCPTGSYWYSSSERNGTSAGNAKGILKGPDAGVPAFTAAESYFLQAEAVVRGILSTGTAKTLFENGITASFHYLYQLPDGTVNGDPAADALSYIAANTSGHLVNFDQAATLEQKIEAIITQKYIALNFVNSQEGWNEYRRTGYPLSSGNDAYQTFASISSQSTRSDKLPTRIIYPASEASYNAANVPQNISPFSSTIFWAK